MAWYGKAWHDTTWHVITCYDNAMPSIIKAYAQRHASLLQNYIPQSKQNHSKAQTPIHVEFA